MFLILHQLVQTINGQSGAQNPDGMGVAPPEASQNEENKRKVLYVDKIPTSLDPNLKFFMNSVKTALLMRTISLRLVIIEGEKCIAGQDHYGQQVEGAINQ